MANLPSGRFRRRGPRGAFTRNHPDLGLFLGLEDALFPEAPDVGYGGTPSGSRPMKELDHFVAGKYQKGASGRSGDVFNPATGEVQAKVAFASRSELREAVGAATKAFAEWSQVNPQRRARVLFNFKSLVEKHMDELAQLLSSEHGKVLADSRGDIQRGL